MMKRIFFFLIPFTLALGPYIFSQNVGIGTATPNSKAILDVKATDKGVLFPRLTSAQRNAITNPPNGLHVFNTDERCLNYYDSVYATWNCYCENDTCKVVTINISEDVSNLNFYAVYGSKYPGIKKFVIFIGEDVYITGINFGAFPYPSTVSIKILNYGLIYGVGGRGGQGAAGQVGTQCDMPADPGRAGGDAIITIPGIVITVLNAGIVAGGGGGGGGGGKTALGQYGGGGGAGAGFPLVTGGSGGGTTGFFCSTFCVCGLIASVAANGTSGTNLIGGNGGAGANGGGTGGNGAGLAQTGQIGTGTAGGAGGAPGKAINGGSGNSIINIGIGQSFGVVD